MATLALAGCGGQSALDPAGPDAAAIATTGWIMFAGGAVVLAVVVLAIVLSLGRGRLRDRIGTPRAIIAGGVVFPAVVLTVLLVGGLFLTRSINAAPDNIPVVHVTGEQYWWRVAYLDAAGAPAFVTANEIRIPVGQPMRFVLGSADVIHSFWVPALGGKLDMIPGRTNETVLAADRPGTYRGQCAEFCGDQHALMAFEVVALEPDDYAAWLRAQQAPAAEPATDEATRGRVVFLREGCGACHSVRGTSAGTIGPDLTHVGSRLTIAAGTLPNHGGTLAGWIADAQGIKPGSRMPSFDELSGVDLRAIAAYLEGLK